MKNAKIFFILLALVFESCKRNDHVISAEEADYPPIAGETVKIISFNIQIFGVSKMAKPEVVSILTDIISQADIVAIQELRSAGIEPVEQLMALLPEKYSYVIGPREGRSSSKEQYWTIYDTCLFTVLGQETWADENDIFERNPLGVYFKSSDNFDFILINNHIRPGSAEAEINALPELVDYYRDLWNEPDVLIVGDFNADGQYYDERLLENVFDESGYKIIITNEYDTTISANDYTYDRFIITSSAVEDYTGNFGIIRYDELYDFSQYGIEPKEVSDHYPVWAEFFLSRDTD
ncbi:MAG: endonuclease [Treponema sp.]|jgi:endonuclease/exonuclease/phosphatase family metal-dependent hydrolase|nr:endonuclease [Treponema sp.]